MDLNPNVDIPDEILEEAAAVKENLLPDKSSERYKQCFNLFKTWLNDRSVSQS